jgi:hypothetical protein
VDLEARRRADDFVGDLLRRLDAARRELHLESGTAGDAADTADADPDSDADADADAGSTGRPPVEGVPTRADLEKTLDGLFANQRARRLLKDARPDAQRMAALLDEVEAILLDRLGDEG